jgi:hypothetical protein
MRKKENQSSSSDSSTCNDSTAVSSVLSEVNGVLYGSPLTDSTPVTTVIGNVQDGITSTSTPITSQHQQQQHQQQQQSDSSLKSPSKDACPPWAQQLVTAFGKLDFKVNGLYKKLEKLESVESKVSRVKCRE